MKVLARFKLVEEKEDFQNVKETILNGIEFKGTNLWILIFAIFIASLGLNVNSTAVIIGAMLVSPLMGPIIGMGFGMAIYDVSLLKKSFFSYLFAAGVSLATSTLFFLLSPLNQAHSEILARISPNIYDVLIAFFGGLAGILAISSKLKGNVITGVAIATALMPPLCTAGYGLATLQFSFFIGAFYLFFINTVFIALATLFTTRFLKFPKMESLSKNEGLKANRIIWVVVTLTLFPSIYFGYDMVQQNRYEQRANQFIKNEATFKNDYLLKKVIDPKNKIITITFGGEKIEEKQIEDLKKKLPNYNLENATLIVHQGFSYLQNTEGEEQRNQYSIALEEKDIQIKEYQKHFDSLQVEKQLIQQIYRELKTQYPTILACVLQKVVKQTDTIQQPIWVAIIQSNVTLNKNDKINIVKWLKVRMNIGEVDVYFE